MKMETLVNELKQQRGLIVAIVAMGLIFGFVVGRAIKGREAGEIIVADEKTATTTVEVKKIEESKKEKKIEAKKEVVFSTSSVISVSNKQPAGQTVVVNKVTLKQDSWVVVQEDVGGEIGNILGAQWLPNGTDSGTTVELLRRTEAGKKYYVVLWSDNGDRIFGKDLDAPIKNNGNLISTTFIAE